jgi:hypothetical protein
MQILMGVGTRTAPLKRFVEGVAEAAGLRDLANAGDQIASGRYAAAAGSLIFALGGSKIPGGRVAANFARTLRAAQGANVTVGRLGKFYKATWEVAGEGGGQSRTVWTKIMNEKGETVRLYHDSYDRAGRFQHRKFKYPDNHIAY